MNVTASPQTVDGHRGARGTGLFVGVGEDDAQAHERKKRSGIEMDGGECDGRDGARGGEAETGPKRGEHESAEEEFLEERPDSGREEEKDRDHEPFGLCDGEKQGFVDLRNSSGRRRELSPRRKTIRTAAVHPPEPPAREGGPGWNDGSEKFPEIDAVRSGVVHPWIKATPTLAWRT